MYVEYDYIRCHLVAYITLEACKMPVEASSDDDWMDLDEEIEQERISKEYEAVISCIVDGGKDIFAPESGTSDSVAMSNQAHRAQEYDSIINIVRRHGYCLFPRKEGLAEFDFDKVAQIIGADGLAGLASAIYLYGQDKFQEGYLDAKNEQWKP